MKNRNFLEQTQISNPYEDFCIINKNDPCDNKYCVIMEKLTTDEKIKVSIAILLVLKKGYIRIFKVI
jgi:hypothetical protein